MIDFDSVVVVVVYILLRESLKKWRFVPVFQFFKSKAFPKLKKFFAKLIAEHTAESCSTLPVNLPIPSLLIKNWNTGTNSCFPVRNQCFALFQ